MESLLTNIPLERTINICCDFLFGNEAKKKISVEMILKPFDNVSKV